MVVGVGLLDTRRAVALAHPLGPLSAWAHVPMSGRPSYDAHL